MMPVSFGTVFDIFSAERDFCFPDWDEKFDHMSEGLGLRAMTNMK